MQTGKKREFAVKNGKSFSRKWKLKELLLSVSVCGILGSLYLYKWTGDLGSNFEPLLDAHRRSHVITHSWLVQNLGAKLESVDDESLQESIEQTLNRFPSAKHFIFDAKGRLVFSSQNSHKVSDQIKKEPWVWDDQSTEEKFLVKSFKFLRKENVSLGNLIQARPDFVVSKSINPHSGAITLTLTSLRDLLGFAMQTVKAALGWIVMLSFGPYMLMLVFVFARDFLNSKRVEARERVSKNVISQRAPSRPAGISLERYQNKNMGKAFVRVERGNSRVEWQEIVPEKKNLRQEIKVKSLRDLIDS